MWGHYANTAKLQPYSLDLPAALALAHRALAKREILALPTALIERLAFLTGIPDIFFNLTLAHRALAAAAILALTMGFIF